MQRRQIPGLSIAIIEDGKIVKAQGYGVTEKGGKPAVTPATLFQAGSISKSVAALGALHLVEQGKLALDEDVNAKLMSWKVPDNAFTADKKVTLRGLLSHTAGLTVHGFPGYATDAPVPTLVQVLDGAKPANTAPIRVDITPGSKWRYSGGGYTVMQQLMTDVTGKPFPRVHARSGARADGHDGQHVRAAAAGRQRARHRDGHYADRKPVTGPLARLSRDGGGRAVDHSVRPGALRDRHPAARSPAPPTRIPAAMTRAMLTDQKDERRPRRVPEGRRQALEFSHGGRDEGFDAQCAPSPRPARAS